jgi:hypothetical protein
MAIHPDDLSRFERSTSELGVSCWVIGRFIAEPKGKILLK